MKLIIGLTGYSCTGKSTFYEYVSEAYSVPRITTGDLVRKEVKKRGLELITSNISEISDAIRRETGNNFMMIAEDEIAKLSERYDTFIIDSLREEKDYDTLRRFSKAIETVAVISSSRVRYERMSKRKRKGDPLSCDEFLVLEQKERLLGVEQLVKSAEYVVKNEDNLEEFKSRSLGIMKELVDKYHLSV